MPHCLNFAAPRCMFSQDAPHVMAGCAVARSVIRRSGFTLAEAAAAALACLRGAHPDSYNRAAAAAWFRAQSAGVAAAWPGGRQPAGVRLVTATWPARPGRGA